MQTISPINMEFSFLMNTYKSLEELCKQTLEEAERDYRNAIRREKRAIKFFEEQRGSYKKFLYNDGSIGEDFFISECALNSLTNIQTELTREPLNEENKKQKFTGILKEVLEFTGHKNAEIFLVKDKNGEMSLGKNSSGDYLERVASIGKEKLEEKIYMGSENPVGLALPQKKPFQFKKGIIFPLIFDGKLIGASYISSHKDVVMPQKGIDAMKGLWNGISPNIVEKDYEKAVSKPLLDFADEEYLVMSKEYIDTIMGVWNGISSNIVENTIEKYYREGFGKRWPDEITKLLMFKPAKFEKSVKGERRYGVYLFANYKNSGHFIGDKDDPESCKKASEDGLEYNAILADIIQKYQGKIGFHPSDGVFGIFNSIGTDFKSGEQRESLIEAGSEMEEAYKKFDSLENIEELKEQSKNLIKAASNIELSSKNFNYFSDEVKKQREALINSAFGMQEAYKTFFDYVKELKVNKNNNLDDPKVKKLKKNAAEAYFKTQGAYKKFNSSIGGIVAENHCKNSIKAAFEIQEASRKFFLEKYGEDNSYLHIGINDGEVLFTNVASSNVKEFSVIGNEVNVAGRISAEAEKLDEKIIVSRSVLKSDDFNKKYIGKIKVKNIEEPVEIYSAAAKERSGLELMLDGYKHMISSYLTNLKGILREHQDIDKSAKRLRSKGKELAQNLKALKAMDKNKRLGREKKQTYENNFAGNVSNEITSMMLKTSLDKRDPILFYKKVLEKTAELIGFKRGGLTLFKTEDHGDPDIGHYLDDDNFLVDVAFIGTPKEYDSDLNVYDSRLYDLKKDQTELLFAIQNQKPLQMCANIKELPKFQKEWIIKNNYIESKKVYYEEMIKKDENFKKTYPSFDIFLNDAVLDLTFEGNTFGAMSFDMPIGRNIKDPVPEETLESMKKMASTLVNRIVYMIRQNRYIKEIKSCYPKKLIESMLYDREKYKKALIGDVHDISALCVDIVGYSSYAEKRTPEEITENLNKYNDIVDSVFEKYGIVISRHPGDSCDGTANFFNDTKDYADNSVKAIIEINEKLKDFNREMQENNKKFQFKINVGITTGYDHVGNKGTENRIELRGTRIPKSAYKLEESAENGQLLIDENTFNKLSKIKENGKFYFKSAPKYEIKSKEIKIKDKFVQVYDISKSFP